MMRYLNDIRFRMARYIFDRLDWCAKDALVRHAFRSYEHLTYNRLRRNGMRVATIVDVGAYRGDWSRMIRSVFPAARIHMVEAQPELAATVSSVAHELGNAVAHSALLSSTDGEQVPFHVMGTGSSMRRENSTTAADTVLLRTRTLDGLLAEETEEPLFLKLDVQGAEIDILKGGSEALGRADYVQLEVAFQAYNEGAPMLADVMEFMLGQKFLATEMVGFSRPAEHLVQADFLFARDGDVLRPRRFDFG